MALLPVADALRLLLDGARPRETETVPLADAAGRVLAEPLKALRTQPPFDASAMDGYAVRAADVANVPVQLEIIGAAPAGRRFPGKVGPGQAVRIFTGAPMPKGADTIVIQENTSSVGENGVEVTEAVAAGHHIRSKGLDFAEGDLLLERGRVLDAAALSLAASANHATLRVVKRPLVAIIATGDELAPPGSEPGPDQIIASNALGVGAIVQSAGARVIDLGIAQDSKESISALVRRAMDAQADVIVTLGGASVGDHDLIHDVLTSEGVVLDFWKIAMRPGKPLMFGRLGATRCLGLPGNPVAGLVCSHLFLKPLLAQLGGVPHQPDLRRARLATALPANDTRQDYIRAVVKATPDGLIAAPFGIQDSSMLKIFADANALIVREPFAAAADVGASCDVLMLR
ncbi:gephyrin-like molybdotransferase Glp [Mesorhizobium sp. WSM2239]|uniref:Molybdopterin molybdenumtransferase n=2 Tax=unclassified Mesorhizobium TaxID=325217 RepID=A0AAU8D506_9HYPH